MLIYEEAIIGISKNKKCSRGRAGAEESEKKWRKNKHHHAPTHREA
jgi:hypothetical protein